ncbi:MAG: antitoxin component of MazEF toxin-antitoxin module [Candidatus Saccharimonadales bacterium]|jgi:antitoxin component of MazEF toxin-antitoxin module
MTAITSIQKVITVGASSGVTLPAKDLDSMGIKKGDNLKVTFEPVKENKPDNHTLEVVELTQNLIQRHKQALKNLNQR